MDGLVAGWNGVGIGMITGVGTAGRHKNEGLQNPFSIYDSTRHQAIYTDLPGVQYATLPIDEANASHASARTANGRNAIGMVSSYLESSVMEEVLNVESVSTAKGLQWALAHAGTILHFDSDHMTVNGVSPTTLFGAGDTSEATAGIRNEIASKIAEGYSIDVPNTLIHINDWKGAVWIQTKASANGGVSSGFIISQNGEDAHGGAPTTFDPAPTTLLAPPPDSGSDTRSFNNPINYGLRRPVRDPAN